MNGIVGIAMIAIGMVAVKLAAGLLDVPEDSPGTTFLAFTLYFIAVLFLIPGGMGTLSWISAL